MLIIAPNKEFTGEAFGVAFQDGKGITNNEWLITRFKEKGFDVQSEPEKKDISTLEAENVKLKARIAELEKAAEPDRELIKEELKELGIEFAPKTSTTKLQELLEQSKAEEDE